MSTLATGLSDRATLTAPGSAMATPLAALLRDAASSQGFGTDVAATIAWARQVGVAVPQPGTGRTAQVWELLAQTAALDVGGARILEPHLDALAILAQAENAGMTVDLQEVDATESSTWGVFAAEGQRLEAVRNGDVWLLSGTKPWCSLASTLTHALVTAWTGSDQRRLFAVSLQQDDVHPHSGPWAARGLTQIVSAAVDFDNVPAVPVGDDDWYLHRPGFAWGGMGVAAAWWGGGIPLADAVIQRAAAHNADQLASVFAGRCDTALHAMRVVLQDAAGAVDAGIEGDDAKTLADRVRALIVMHTEEILAVADRSLGPAPLTADEEHARRVADLRVYLRQHHAERDLAKLGRRVAGA